MRYLILLFGVFACATSVIFIRTSSTDPLLLSAYRLLLGVVFLLPLTWRARRRHPTYRMSREFRQVLWPGALLALHFITWIDGARQTAAANATLLVNMTPVAMPFFLWFVARERVTRGEMLGTLVVLMGVVLLVAADLRYAGQNVLGDVICFVSMLLYTAYLAFARRNRAIPSIYLYVV
ncbi:MAG: EamA family transporter, partial [Verrucomicrobiota bacterium]